MTSEQYAIYLLETVAPANRADIAQSLAPRLQTSAERLINLLSRPPGRLTKALPLSKGLQTVAALRSAGVNVRLKPYEVPNARTPSSTTSNTASNTASESQAETPAAASLEPQSEAPASPPSAVSTLSGSPYPAAVGEKAAPPAPLGVRHRPDAVLSTAVLKPQFSPSQAPRTAINTTNEQPDSRRPNVSHGRSSQTTPQGERVPSPYRTTPTPAPLARPRRPLRASIMNSVSSSALATPQAEREQLVWTEAGVQPTKEATAGDSSTRNWPLVALLLLYVGLAFYFAHTAIESLNVRYLLKQADHLAITLSLDFSDRVSSSELPPEAPENLYYFFQKLSVLRPALHEVVGVHFLNAEGAVLQPNWSQALAATERRQLETQLANLGRNALTLADFDQPNHLLAESLEGRSLSLTSSLGTLYAVAMPITSDLGTVQVVMRQEDPVTTSRRALRGLFFLSVGTLLLMLVITPFIYRKPSKTAL